MAIHCFTRADLDHRFSSIIGKTLGDVDKNHVFDKAIKHPKITGIAGDVIEQSVLEYPANSAKEPDLEVDGVPIELKTTGVRKKEHGYEAKEPMSITAVSIGKIEKENLFEESAFWEKCEHMLLVFYHYLAKNNVPAIEYKAFPIVGYTFNEFTEEDKATLKNDWKMIRDFIRELSSMPDPESEYPRLSSELRDKLAYIDTAPKYPHPPRFRLKRNFVSSLVRRYFDKERATLDSTYSSYDSFYGRCHSITELYGNKNIGQIAELLGVMAPKTKSAAEYVIVRMFGGSGKKLNNIDFFRKYSIRIKTLTLSSSDKRTEDMKLFPLDFDEVSNPDLMFEESSFFEYFFNQHFLFPIFKEPFPECPLSENIFLGFKEMMFSESFIDEVAKPLFCNIQRLIVNHELKNVPCYTKNGRLRINKKTGTIMSAPNFPKSRDGVLFIRGGGNDSLDKKEYIEGVSMYYQTVWCKGTYIVSELSKIPFL